jgi:hypothetical protein
MNMYKDFLAVLKQRVAPCLLCITGLFAVSSAVYANSVDLGSASPFTVLSASGAVNCTNSTIQGDVGSAVAGTRTSCVQSGDVVTAVSQEIQTDFHNAYSTLADEQCDNYLTTLAGQTLAPGTYCVDNASTNTGSVLTLNGDDDDTWLFKIGSSGAGALTGTDFVVDMIGDAQACNVTWWVADAVTLTRGDFKGDILAGQAVTVTGVASNSPLKGRIMAEGTVVLTNADALGCVAEAAARTAEAIAAAEAAQLAADDAAAAALLVVVNTAILGVTGINNVNIRGADGAEGTNGTNGTNGAAGADGTNGLDGANGSSCTVTKADGTATIQCGVGNMASVEDGSSVSGNAQGDMQYWDGAEWVVLAAPIDNAPSLSFCGGKPTWNNGGCPAPIGTYTIGQDGPAGGTVFYTTDNGFHGYEAAPVNHQVTAEWGCYGTNINTGTAIGTGAANTANIIAWGCSGPNSAAAVANAYYLNGFADWFLPSSDLLEQLRLNSNRVAGLIDGEYWSSSQQLELNDEWYPVSEGARHVEFPGGWGDALGNKDKLTLYRVRAVRAF